MMPVGHNGFIEAFECSLMRRRKACELEVDAMMQEDLDFRGDWVGQKRGKAKVTLGSVSHAIYSLHFSLIREISSGGGSVSVNKIKVQFSNCMMAVMTLLF